MSKTYPTYSQSIIGKSLYNLVTYRFADEKDESREMEVSEANVEEDESREQADKPRPTSLQQKMLAMAGQDIDQFMKEVITLTVNMIASRPFFVPYSLGAR